MIGRRGLLGAFLAAPAVIAADRLMRMPPSLLRPPVGILRMPGLLMPGLREWKGNYAAITLQWKEARGTLPGGYTIAESDLVRLTDLEMDASLHRQRLLKEMHRLEAEMRVALGRTL